MPPPFWTFPSIFREYSGLVFSTNTGVLSSSSGVLSRRPMFSSGRIIEHMFGRRELCAGRSIGLYLCAKGPVSSAGNASIWRSYCAVSRRSSFPPRRSEKNPSQVSGAEASRPLPFHEHKEQKLGAPKKETIYRRAAPMPRLQGAIRSLIRTPRPHYLALNLRRIDAQSYTQLKLDLRPKVSSPHLIVAPILCAQYFAPPQLVPHIRDQMQVQRYYFVRAISMLLARITC